MMNTLTKHQSLTILFLLSLLLSKQSLGASMWQSREACSSTPCVISPSSLFFGVKEKFNRYYTDTAWQSSRTIYVSRTSHNTKLSGNSRQTPVTLATAIDNLKPGDLVYILADPTPYNEINIFLTKEDSGNHNNPIVFYGERNKDGTLGVTLNCKEAGKWRGQKSCFNLEGANYIAIDGFEMVGGDYGIRAVGLGFSQKKHQKGLAALNNIGHKQYRDPFFTGQSDWTVFENNIAYDAEKGDGHGIYISNGSDWNIVRFNELFHNTSSDLQINADPRFACRDQGIDYDDIRCHGDAKNGYSQGISEYILVENNFFHDGHAQGPNFTSVRHAVVRNNIFGPYKKHNTSFWQETGTPKLAPSHNFVNSNLFVGHKSHLLQFIGFAENNTVSDNIFVALTRSGKQINKHVTTIMESANAHNNTIVNNYYIGGQLDGHTLHSSEHYLNKFSPTWFENFSYKNAKSPKNWQPTPTAPFSSFGNWHPPQLAPDK